jgi:hypothetical protein
VNGKPLTSRDNARIDSTPPLQGVGPVYGETVRTKKRNFDMLKFEVVTNDSGNADQTDVWHPKPPFTLLAAPHVGDEIEVGEKWFSVSAIRFYASMETQPIPEFAGVLFLNCVKNATNN